MNTSEIGHSAYFYFSEVIILWILNDSRWAARCGNPIRTKTQMYLTNNKHVAESLLSTEQIYTTKSKMWALQGHNLFQQNK